ncbi:hypothetical protein [Nocardia rhizosphaerae]|uniref:Uncharacterized protein n=1 Tax=Nocardia rhizosphaerae TaxID=1691571 RepID=A0ABV8KZY5_9NOCA
MAAPPVSLMAAVAGMSALPWLSGEGVVGMSALLWLAVVGAAGMSVLPELLVADGVEMSASPVAGRGGTAALSDSAGPGSWGESPGLLINPSE